MADQLNQQTATYQQLNGSGDQKLQHSSGQKKRFWPPRSKRMPSDNLPLAEAAKIELAITPAKTPVSILQELLSKRGTAPQYDLMQIEGAVHEPTFRYRVTVCDNVAVGTGRSKKDAKHAAAKNILDKIVGNPVSDENIPTAAVDTTDNSVVYEDKIPGNPIGTLQELCMSRRWPPPTYEMTCEEGLPHEREFTIACVVYKYREVGSGKSKKLAKRQAAHKMIEKIQSLPVDEGSQVLDEVGGKLGDATSRYESVKNTRIPTLTQTHSHKVSMFHKTLKKSTGHKLNFLQSISLKSPEINYVKLLQEIASEQQFEVTYVDIEEKSLSGKYQCLIQLSTLPVAVCYGSGSNSKEAQSAAAHNALEYLKIMTKK